MAEAYPAASLKQWGLHYRGYRQPRNPAALPELASELQAAAPWLEIGPHDHLRRTSHDALDAHRRLLLRTAAQRAHGAGRRLVLVIDGLDDLTQARFRWRVASRSCDLTLWGTGRETGPLPCSAR